MHPETEVHPMPETPAAPARTAEEEMQDICKQRWRSLVYRHAGHLKPGQSLEPRQTLLVLQAAIDPGCPGVEDVDYYVRVAAGRFARYELREHRDGHHEEEKEATCPMCYPAEWAAAPSTGGAGGEEGA